MTRSSNKWPVCIVVLLFLGPWAVFAHAGECGKDSFDSFAARSDPNRPVSSTDPGERRGSGIGEGVSGRVTGPDNRPVEGAFIQPRSLDDPSPPIPEIAILSGDDGRYSWPLLPGDYEITVTARGYAGAAKTTTVKAGQVTPLDFHLERES